MLSLFLLLFSAVLLVVAYAMLSKEERKLTAAAAEKAVRESTKELLTDAYRILCGEEPYRCVPFLRLVVLLERFQFGWQDEPERFVRDAMVDILMDSETKETLGELVEISRQLYQDNNLSEVDPNKLKGLKDFICSWLDGLKATE